MSLFFPFFIVFIGKNSTDPDETPRCAASHLVLHYLLKITFKNHLYKYIYPVSLMRIAFSQLHALC